MTSVVLILMGVSFAIAAVSCVVLLRISERAGWLDKAGHEAHKLHDHAVPNTGGVAIFWAVILPIAVVLLAVWTVPVDVLPKAVAYHAQGLRDVSSIGLLLLSAVALLHVVGLIDDRHTLGPAPKLLAQLAIAAMLVIAGDMRVLNMLDLVDWYYSGYGYTLSVLISILWIVVIINAFNFLDNMDGLSSGVALIIAGLYLVITLVAGQWFVAGLSAMLIGALLGFLWFNLPPAKLFMGDGGSLIVGLLLAVISIRTTYYDSHHIDRQVHALLVPVVMMAVPLYDCLSVTVIRLSQGQSPWRGDHNHFSHRLVRLGLSKRRAVAVIWLITFATATSSVLIGTLNSNLAILAALQVLVMLTILATLENSVHRPPV